MDLSEFRPVLSGLIGGALAIFLGAWWKRRQPAELRRAREEIYENHKVAVVVASLLFFAGIGVSLWLYQTGVFENNDPIALGLGVGGGCALTLLTLVVFPLVTGRSIRQAFIAFAGSEAGPPFLTFTILGLGVVGFLFALGGLLTR